MSRGYQSDKYGECNATVYALRANETCMMSWDFQPNAEIVEKRSHQILGTVRNRQAFYRTRYYRNINISKSIK